MRLRCAGLALLALLAAPFAVAQLSLVVDGRDVPGVTSTLVPGSSYAPGGELAAAVGADMFVDRGGDRVTLAMGGRFLTLPVVDAGASALAVQGALDGIAVPTGAAVRSGVEIFLPVKGVVEAFGGTVTYVQAENRVIGVLPRAEVQGATIETVGGAERLRVRVSAPVPHSAFENASLATLQLRLARASLDRAQTLEGDAFVRADLIPGPGVVDVRIQLAPGAEATVTTLPSGRGFALIVEARRAGERPEADVRPRIVVDPGHGGDDPGLRLEDGRTEDALAWAFAERLADALRERRVDVATTRRGDEPVSIQSRSAAGVGVDLFVSVHAAELPAGQFRVYYLGEADTVDELDFAIRENAAAEARSETDAVRRRILLDLVPDLDTGRRYAAALGNQLFQLGGYRSAESKAAPLAVLTGAAGRGLLIEFAPIDLASDVLPDLLAAALASVVGSDGFE